MRPYSIRKDDKYIQPNIQHNLTGVQPSPLALLAATCSRIGETLHENNTVYTQKTSGYLGKDKTVDDFTYTKSCIEGSRVSVFPSLDQQRSVEQLQVSCLQTTNMQFQQQQQQQPAPPSCMKIKHELENYDYNHNILEQEHICTTNMHETRTYENQSRVKLPKTCCHEPFRSSASFIQVRNENLSYSTSVLTSEPSSCLYQGSVNNHNSNFNEVVPPPLNQPGNEQTHIPNTNKPHYSPWQQSEQPAIPKTNIQHPTELKSSCMMYGNYENNTSPLQHYNNTSIQQQIGINTSRDTSRNSLSHMTDVTEISSRHYSPPVSNALYSSQASTFQPYTNYNAIIDEKPDTYALQQAYNSQQSANYQHVHHQIPNVSSSIQPNPIGIIPHGMTGALANQPIEGNSNFANAYHPTMIGNNIHINNPMNNMNEFPYNQAFYAREYRRPRRIACTCPYCRDGENKTVTTRDGKQKKQHICHVPGCSKVYGKTSHLRAHLRWHAGERPFACNWLFCNKRFTRSDELQRHRRTHTGDKRFECSICLKKFMRSDHLSKHMKTHQAQNNKNKDKNETKTNSSDVSKSNEKDDSPANTTETSSSTSLTSNLSHSLAL